MTKLRELQESMGVEEGAIPIPATRLKGGGIQRKQTVIQYLATGNAFQPVGEVITTPILPPGTYQVKQTMNGPVFEVHSIRTDELLRFEDSRYNMVLEEISYFWGLRKKYEQRGFTHKRGVLLYGAPGTGKSCLLKLVMEDTIAKGDIVLVAKNARVLREGVAKYREVEPKRQVLVILEDIDEIIRYDERTILEMFDGDDQMDGILYLATTNYIHKLPPRIIRPGRFDRKIEVYNPPEAGREAYFRHKLGDDEPSKRITELVEKTKGFSFGQLREFMVGVYCLDQPEDGVADRIRKNLEEGIAPDNKLAHLESLLS